ncbi:extracellular solute-binding protein [Aeromonas media]|uniref:extracellular solute-binding protein n=1 Tax=Aeromonas media TaxID=651 RepID=UPI0038D181E8
MKKIKLLALLVAGATLSPITLAQTTLQYWTLLNGGDGARMKQLVDGFNASQGDYKIETTTLNWGEPFYTKLKTASAMGSGPDMATIHLSKISGLTQTQGLEPINPEVLKQAGYDSNQLFPLLWKQSNVDGKTYALPIDTHAMVLYYNKRIAAKAGLLDEQGRLKPIASLAQFDAALKSVKEQGAMGLSMETSPMSYMPYRLWLSMISQQGGKTIENNEFVYGEAGKQAMAAMARWYAYGYATKGLDYASSTTEFMTGRSAFMLNGVWELPSVTDGMKSGKLGFEVGIASLPSFFNGSRAAWADSHALAIPCNKDKPISDEKVLGIAKFANYINQNALTWAEGGHIPAYEPTVATQAFKEMPLLADYVSETASNIVYDPDGWYSGAAGPLQATASKYFPAALTGQLPIEKALQMFERDAGKFMSRPAR